MKLWSAFYDLALPEVPGCPFVALDAVLRRSAIAFCEQTLAWKYDHPAIAVTPGVDEYDFVPPEGAAVESITWAAFGDREINARNGEWSARIAEWPEHTGEPQYVLGGSVSLTLLPIPSSAGTLKLEVALKPSPDATGVPDDIYNEYREAIVHGALSRLMISPNKPYTNAQLALHHQQQYIITTAAAGVRAGRNHTREPLRTAILRR